MKSIDKRAFIVRGGGALLGGALWPMAQADACSAAPTSPTAQPADDTPLAAPQGMRGWQALQGLSFGTHTTLGRPLQLVLSHVSFSAHKQNDTGLEQFSVHWQGPCAKPLQAGLHHLHHPDVGQVALYLEPTGRDGHMTYAAHFSLTRT